MGSLSEIGASLRAAFKPDVKRPERAIYLAASAALVVAGAMRSKRVELVAKPLVMASIATGLTRTTRRRDPLDNALLFGAAGASFVGDWFMLQEEFAPDEETADKQIQRGALCFAVNHKLLILLALRHGARPTAKEALMRLPALAEGGAVLALNKPQLLPVLGPYSAILATLSTVIADPSIVPDDAAEDDPRRGLAPGGLSFISSDGMILHRRTFLKNPIARGAAEAWVLATYVIAQALVYDGLERVADNPDLAHCH